MTKVGHVLMLMGFLRKHVTPVPDIFNAELFPRLITRTHDGWRVHVLRNEHRACATLKTGVGCRSCDPVSTGD